MKRKPKPKTQPWPPRLPNDPEPVKLLLDEAERLTKLANTWDKAEHSNPLAISNTWKLALTMAQAGAWLRCKLRGEFDQDPLDPTL